VIGFVAVMAVVFLAVHLIRRRLNRVKTAAKRCKEATND